MANVFQILAKLAGGVGGANVELQGDPHGSLLVSYGLPPYADLVRRGKSWGTMSTAAVAALVVRPGTVAAFEIFNAYPSGGKSLVVDRLFWFNLVSASVAQAWLGWAQVTAPKAAPTSGSFVVRGASGQAYGGPVIAAAGTTVADSGWFPWSGASTEKVVEATVTPHGGIVTEVAGRLIVPPQCSLCMHVVAQTVASTFTQGATWFEVQLALE